MKIVAFLPMKGHSERVPNKNIRLFNGQPLFHVVLKQLLKSKHAITVAINTDSDLIKDNVKELFPEVIIIDRPAALQGDFVPMNEIIEHDLNMLEADLYIQTHSTSPLLSYESLDKAIDLFSQNQHIYDSLFTVTKLQTRLYWENGTPVNHDPNVLLRTQDLPPVFEENSNFYLFTKESFYASGKKRIGVNPMMFPIDKIEAVDIDEPEDFIIAEILHKQRNS